MSVDVLSERQTITRDLTWHATRESGLALPANVPLFLFRLDEHGNFLTAEGAGLLPLGIQDQALGGAPMARVFRALPSLLDGIQRAQAGHSTTVEFQIGNTFHDAWLSPIVYPDGSRAGVSGVVLTRTQPRPDIASLREQAEHYQLLAEHTTDLITIYSPDGVCRYASPSSIRLLGYQPEELLGRSVFDLFHEEDLKTTKKRFLSKILEQPDDNEAVSYRIRRHDGHYIWLETVSKIICNDLTGAVEEIIAVSRDITQRKETEERLLYLANYDSLTGLPNRTMFRDCLRRAVARAQRNDTRVALLFLDLDRFKNINDSLGHHVGDQLLKGVAKRLQKHAREGDTVARLGGDEFTVILEGVREPEDAAAVARKILELMEPPFKLDGHDIVVSTSIGITIFPDDAGDMRSLLKNADTAMYRTKEKGRNSYHFYTADMNDKAIEHLMLENNLRRALEREEFKLYFQPQFDLHTQGIIGIEALLRWQHPEQGMIYPDQFVPFAEETGLIVPIGEWVIRAACWQARAWQKAGVPSVRVAVNLSMRQFRQRNFVELVYNALNETGLHPRFLDLEITEGFLASNVEKATEVLQDLHSLGVHLSIDDFGTGYSSLNYLKRFPLNTLKIDQSFVQDISRNADNATIAEAIIALGKSLRLNVIAEGVETEEQAFFLRGRGCDHVQGYLFSHPLPASEIEILLRENRANQMAYEQWALWPEVAVI